MIRSFLSRMVGEALGDEPSKEETLAAWEAFEKKHISSEKEHLQKAEDELSEKKIDKARILTWITASVAVAASLFLFIFRSSQEISQPTEFSMELFSEVTSPKQVEQTLSDGTKVMLNANSTLDGCSDENLFEKCEFDLLTRKVSCQRRLCYPSF